MRITLDASHPHLISEWDFTKNPKPPSEYTKGSTKSVFWLCKKGHSFSARVDARSKSKPTGCPYCTGRLPIVGETDLATTHPELSKELVDTDPTTVKAGTNKDTQWVCSKGHQYLARISHRAMSGSGCPYCAGTKVLPGHNDLSSTHPELASQLVGTDPATISKGSEAILTWVCLEGHQWTAHVYNRTGVNGTGCPRCSLSSKGSKAESEILEFIRTHYSGEVIHNDRKTLVNFELDIYLPELSIAFEYNGCYWHSELFRDSSYHKDKVDSCSEKGIQLVTIWEDDYNLRREVVLRMILHKLGLSQEEKVPARKTEVVVVKNHEAFKFLESNHIQGKASGTYYIGLREKESKQIVAVMVLKRTKDTLSLERYATSKIVSGGQSKLLKYVDQNIDYSKMTTFADRTISDGNLYKKSGWVEETEIAPDYRYLVRNVREHKFGYRKDRFKNDPNLKYVEGYTEKQLAELNGLLRVYDAGKVRFSRVPQFRGRIDN